MINMDNFTKLVKRPLERYLIIEYRRFIVSLPYGDLKPHQIYLLVLLTNSIALLMFALIINITILCST